MNNIFLFGGSLFFLLWYALIIYSIIVQIALNPSLSNRAKFLFKLTVIFFPVIGFMAYFIVVKMRLCTWLNNLLRVK